jgi:hypothetical protein
LKDDGKTVNNNDYIDKPTTNKKEKNKNKSGKTKKKKRQKEFLSPFSRSFSTLTMTEFIIPSSFRSPVSYSIFSSKFPFSSSSFSKLS